MPIVMSQGEWDRIVRWTAENKEDPEALRRREYVKYLNDTSREMTKSWPNSLENVNKRNEEMRRARIEVAEQANSKFYKRYVKRQQEQQRRLMYNARDTIFKNKDAPKLLLSAVVETVVQRERAEQVKFNAELKRQAMERKKNDDDEVMRKAVEWHALNAERGRRRFEVNKKHQKDILEQAHESYERNRMEHEAEVNMQKMDNVMAQKEMADLKKFDEEYKEAEKARIWADNERSRKETEQRRREKAELDKMEDRLLEAMTRAGAKVQQRRLRTEKEIRDEKLRVLEKISQKLESGDAARDAKEQASLDKAIKEKQANDEARWQAQLEKEAKFKQGRVESRRQYLRDEAQRLHEMNTLRQWELMNNFKNKELNEEFQEKLRQERARKIKEYRDEILRLWKEREDREAGERAETRHFYGELAESKLRAADNKLLTHAAALLDEARAHGRPDRPLRRAIDRYCKLYRLYPMPDLPKSLKEHFQRYAPWDGSRPDPGYSEPPAPPPDRGPDAPDEDEAPPKADGLQDPKPGPSKPAQKPKEAVQDYKRQGRANGLQRRSPHHDPTLPPVTVIPCKTPACSCPLKR